MLHLSNCYCKICFWFDNNKQKWKRMERNIIHMEGDGENCTNNAKKVTIIFKWQFKLESDQHLLDMFKSHTSPSKTTRVKTLMNFYILTDPIECCGWELFLVRQIILISENLWLLSYHFIIYLYVAYPLIIVRWHFLSHTHTQHTPANASDWTVCTTNDRPNFGCDRKISKP